MNEIEWVYVVITLVIIAGSMALGGVVTHWIWRNYRG